MERNQSSSSYSPTEPTEHEFTAVIQYINQLVARYPTRKETYDELKRLLERYVRIYISSSNRYDMFAYTRELFSTFCEHDFIKVLQQIISRYKRSEYYVLVIECLGLLSYNLRLDRYIVFFLSRPYLNQIIDSGTLTESESVDVFVQCLKSFAMRLHGTSYWKIFYNSKYSMFPLLWQATRFYNHPDKLIRTTVRSIVLEIAKIKAFTVQAYLNNFPFAVFYAYEMMFTYDSVTTLLKSEPKKIGQSLLDDIYDYITFIEDLAQYLEPYTKLMLFNAFLSYVLRPVWQSLVNQEHKYVEQSNFLLLALVLFSQVRDRILYELLVEVFLTRFISELIDSFFNRGGKQRVLESYSRTQTRKLDRCLTQIQYHSRQIYNRMNSERYEQSESVLSMDNLNFGKDKKKERKSSSIFSKISFLASLSPDHWLQEELVTLSEGLGVAFELDKPAGSEPAGNLYHNFSCLTPEYKAAPYYRRTINPVYNKFHQFIDWDRRSFYMFLQVYLVALADPKTAEIERQLLFNFMDGLAILLYELSRTKEQRCIIALLQVIKIVNRKAKILGLMTEYSYNKLLKLARDLYLGSLMHVQNRLFNEDWYLHIEAFIEVEEKSMKSIDRENYRIDVGLLVTQPACGTERLEAMYFYMIREVGFILRAAQGGTPYYESFAAMFNDLKVSTGSKAWAPFIKDIAFRLDGKYCRLIPEYDYFRIVRQDDQKVVCEDLIKNCTTIKVLESENELRLSVLDRNLCLYFLSPAHKDTWIEGILTLHRTTHELQVQTLIQLIYASPL